jgi:hypothetical protein
MILADLGSTTYARGVVARRSRTSVTLDLEAQSVPTPPRSSTA